MSLIIDSSSVYSFLQATLSTAILVVVTVLFGIQMSQEKQPKVLVNNISFALGKTDMARVKISRHIR